MSTETTPNHAGTLRKIAGWTVLKKIADGHDIKMACLRAAYRIEVLEQALQDISRDGPTHSCGRRARMALEDAA